MNCTKRRTAKSILNLTAFAVNLRKDGGLCLTIQETSPTTCVDRGRSIFRDLGRFDHARREIQTTRLRRITACSQWLCVGVLGAPTFVKTLPSRSTMSTVAQSRRNQSLRLKNPIRWPASMCTAAALRDRAEHLRSGHCRSPHGGSLPSALPLDSREYPLGSYPCSISPPFVQVKCRLPRHLSPKWARFMPGRERTTYD